MERHIKNFYKISLILALIVILYDQALAGLSEKQINTFQSLKSVRIVVDEAYGETKGVSLPFKDVAQRLLKYADVKVVETDSKNYNATLTIEARGRALGDKYSGFGIGPTFYYTGASLSGSISLETPGIPIYKKTFEGHISPPFGISGGSVNPSGAPFHEAFGLPNSFIPAIVEIIGEVFGLKPVVIALKDEDTDVRASAALALGEIKDSCAIKPLIATLKKNKGWFREEASDALIKIGKPSVESLIEALNDDDSELRWKATWALRAITGQDFGDDPAKWQEWWEKDKAK